MIKKLEKILDPKKYREKKANDFLKKVTNLDFKEFKGENIGEIYDYLWGRIINLNQELRELQRCSAMY